MIYNLEIAELIPLKAFYLGLSLRNNAISSKAKDLVDEAIERCGQGEDFSTKKVFYLLLKCELNRNTDSIVRDREIAKNFCDKSDHSDIFLNYMKIVDATQSVKKVIGGGAMSMIKQGEVSEYEDAFAISDDGGVFQIRVELPLNSLDLTRNDLSEEDKKFLYKSSFSEILDKHFEDIDHFLTT